jgi:hypothetical protein
MPSATLHPTGLHPESLAALVLDFMASQRLGLVALAVAADVVSADCRYNHWILTTVKGTNLSKSQWFAILDAGETTIAKCKAAMTALAAGGSIESLCNEFNEVAAALNNRTLPA